MMNRPVHLGCMLACLLLAGCSTVGFQWGAPQAPQGPGAKARVPADGVVGGFVIGAILANGVGYYVREPDGSLTPYRSVPEPDPNRRINVQDCTQRIDLTAGNLMCR